MSDAMLDAMIRLGPDAFIANVSTRLSRIELADQMMPVTCDAGDRFGGSYVCSPHSAYYLYALAELDIVAFGRLAGVARTVLKLVDGLLRLARINRIVHIGNWMLSTNLHGAWRGEGIRAAREQLLESHADHLLGIRSVDDWSSPGLREALLADGWTMVPSRQVWVEDELARQWRTRNNYDNDRRLVERSPLVIDDEQSISDGDAQRIAELYALLYVGRYSPLNPILTAAFIKASADTGMMTYRVARDPGGLIVAVAGMWQQAGIMTPSVVGYDTGRPRVEGLYRIACWMFMQRAMDAGWRLHASAGAADFKRRRGAVGVIEWNAYYTKHLSAGRRAAIAMLSQVLTRHAVPLMVARGW